MGVESPASALPQADLLLDDGSTCAGSEAGVALGKAPVLHSSLLMGFEKRQDLGCLVAGRLGSQILRRPWPRLRSRLRLRV